MTKACHFCVNGVIGEIPGRVGGVTLLQNTTFLHNVFLNEMWFKIKNSSM